MSRKIRYGMVGGGRGAFIGAVHRIAANIDGQIELVCGAFSSDPQKSRASGADFFLPADRCYGTFEEMIQTEKTLPEGERMDFISIVTPNHMHFPAGEDGAGERLSRPLATSPPRSISRRRRSSRQIVKKHRPALRPHAQLHRLPAGERGARDGRCRQARQDPQGGRRSIRRAGSPRASKRAGKSRRAGAPIRNAAAPRAAWATSARTRRTSRNTSPA